MDIRRYFRSNQNENLTESSVNQVEIANVNEHLIEGSIQNLVLNEAASAVQTVSNVNVGRLIQDDIIFTHQKGTIDPNDFEFVPGHRRNTELLYLKNEKCLYIPVNSDKYGKRYKCFTSTCSARVTIRPNGVCEKSKKLFSHIEHKTHGETKAKYAASNNIKQTCANIEALCSGSSQNVSVRDVFDKETIK